VFRVNSGSTDALATSTNVTDYFQTTPAYTQANGKPAPLGGLPQDPGDGSLFQTSARTGLVKNGSGTLTLGPTNTILGPISLNGGITQIKDDFTLGANAVAAQN